MSKLHSLFENQTKETKDKNLTRVVIHTDGGCLGNPGPGGWAAILQSGSHRKEIKGGEKNTTNNRMELTAAIEALKALKKPCDVVLWTDSKYLQQGISEWLPKWKRNGWARKGKKEVKNLDLWQTLDELVSKHTVEFRWLKGHNGHPLNERCDELTQHAIREIQHKPT